MPSNLTLAPGVSSQPFSVAALRVAHRLFADNACDIAFSCTEDGLIDHASEPSLELFCSTRDELLGLTLADVAADTDSKDALQRALRAALAGEQSAITARLTPALGSPLVVHLRCFFDEGTQKAWFTGANLTSLVKEREALEHKALHDNLTGLPGREALKQHVDELIQRSNDTKSGFAVAMMDLDGFKKVNDARGHLVGDLLLKAIAARLQDTVRGQDLVCRLGGDEFVLLLPGVTSPLQARNLCQRVLAAIHLPVEIPGEPSVFIDTSIGVSIYPEHGESAQELLQNADLAMYQSKSLGKGRASLFSSDLQPNTAQLVLSDLMHSAIAAGEFSVHYQPLLDAKQRLRGCEALLRWTRADGTVISPADFIPVAESNGLITVLGDYVLRAATMQLKEFAKRGLPGLYVSVNVSPRQLRHPNFAKSVKQALEVSNLDPSRLILEITESTLVNEPQKTQALLCEISKLGVRFSLDDFGTGYSCLSYLKTYPISVLKVDRSFVRDIVQDSASRAIVKAILDLAKALGLSTVAEGIETAAQFETATSLGVDTYQGFLFSKPLPPVDFVAKFS